MVINAQCCIVANAQSKAKAAFLWPPKTARDLRSLRRMPLSLAAGSAEI